MRTSMCDYARVYMYVYIYIHTCVPGLLPFVCVLLRCRTMTAVNVRRNRKKPERNAERGSRWQREPSDQYPYLKGNTTPGGALVIALYRVVVVAPLRLSHRRHRPLSCCCRLALFFLLSFYRFAAVTTTLPI